MASFLNIELDKETPYPVYMQLFEALKEKIRMGGFTPDEPLPEEREMSRQLEISRPTLRKSLKMLEEDGFIYKIRGRGVFIANKVDVPMKKLNYPRRVIGLSFFETFEESHTVIMVNGAIDLFREKNFLSLRMNFYSSEDEREHIRHNHHLLAGMIMSIPYQHQNYDSERTINFVRSFGIPVAIFGHPEFISDNFKVDAAESDDTKGIGDAVDYFLQNGHKRVTFICCNAKRNVPSLRRDGYRQAMRKAGIPEDMFFLNGSLDNNRSVINEVMENTLELFKVQGKLPSAIIAENDLAAIGVYNAIRELGIETPGKVEFFGYGDDIEAKMFFPDGKLPFSTVSVDRAGVGRKAAELLLRRIESPSSPYLNAKVPPKIIHNGTTRGNKN